MSRAIPISYENVENYTELGMNIAYFRKKKGLTQEQLAEKAGISRSHLSSIEAPNIVKPMSIELLFKIARVLDIQPYMLLKFRE
ncbi:MAG: helix-turn-helix transcriptional regulator [Ruminococcus sp.]|nr:helix-turn-helix transcriptional regulator [Ruminococcus sp.]